MGVEWEERDRDTANDLYDHDQWPPRFLESVRQILKIHDDLSQAGLSFHQALVEAQSVLNGTGGVAPNDSVDGIRPFVFFSDSIGSAADAREHGRGDPALAAIMDNELAEIVEVVQSTEKSFDPSGVEEMFRRQAIEDHVDLQISRIIALVAESKGN